MYLLQATCCADQRHCCPHGYHCTDTGYCVKATMWFFMLRSCVMLLSHCIYFTALVAFFKQAGMWFSDGQLENHTLQNLLDISSRCVPYALCGSLRYFQENPSWEPRYSWKLTFVFMSSGPDYYPAGTTYRMCRECDSPPIYACIFACLNNSY